MGNSPRIPILMYHRIGPRKRNSIVKDQYVSGALFARQLAALKNNGFCSITLDQMMRILKGEERTTVQPIVITFDDGYESFYTEALPIMERCGMTATSFLVANCVGHSNRWDEAKGDTSEPLMSADQIRDARCRGFQFGGHSLTHPDLRFCDDDLARKEIVGCKHVLENMLGFEMQSFSYPYGRHSERDRALAREAGYLCACGTAKQSNDISTDPFALGRINVRATSSPSYLLYKLRKVMKDG